MFFVNHIYPEAVFFPSIYGPCLDVHIVTNCVYTAARHDARMSVAFSACAIVTFIKLLSSLCAMNDLVIVLK